MGDERVKAADDPVHVGPADRASAFLEVLTQGVFVGSANLSGGEPG